MTPAPIITTERLILRAPVRGDLPAYTAFYAESDVTVGGYRGNRSDPEVAAVLDRDIAHWDTLGWPRIETHMRDENLPARNLALRLGGILDRRDTFPDGVARDVFVLPKQEAA